MDQRHLWIVVGPDGHPVVKTNLRDLKFDQKSLKYLARSNLKGRLRLRLYIDKNSTCKSKPVWEYPKDPNGDKRWMPEFDDFLKHADWKRTDGRDYGREVWVDIDFDSIPP